MFQLLDPAGRLRNGAKPPLDDEFVLEGLRWMMRSRAIDARATGLQRQGRLGVFSPVLGQEAAVVGSAMALDPTRDWLVPQYRELPAMLMHGYPLHKHLLNLMGNPVEGRIPDDVLMLPTQVALAAQLPHAVGIGWGLKLQGKDGVVMTYFGEGASSEGDFHEACNLAGVVKAPVVFFLQNNNWAISTPRQLQSSAGSLAERAAGYGMPGVQVDGNDLLAVNQVSREAVARARAGEGPSLIEAITYRMSFHNTTDNPSKYQAPAVDAPLAEAVIIGSAIGLAISGMVPVAEIQFLGFTHQAFHQMGAQLGRFRYRSRGRYPLPVTVRAPMGGGTKTPEFHPDAIEAQFVQSPALKIVLHTIPQDAKGMLLQAIRDPDPVLFIEPERLYRKGRAEVPAEDYTVPFGKARIVREGKDVTLVAWSAAVEVCERAAEQLSGEGVQATVIDLRTLVPLDEETLVKSVESTGRCVVVHEAPLSAGFGAEIVATLQENAFFSLDAPIARVASYDTPYPPASLESHWLPSPDRVVKRVRKLLSA